MARKELNNGELANSANFSGILQITSEITPATGRSAPRFGRRIFNSNLMKILGAAAATELMIESGGVLQKLFPDSIDHEQANISSDKIYFTEKVIKKKVRNVVFGDSIEKGYQGEGIPATPSAQYTVDRVRAKGIDWPDAEILAVEGAPSKDIYDQIDGFVESEILQRQQAINDGKDPDNTPIIARLGFNGNDARAELVNEDQHKQAKQIEENGLVNIDSIIAAYGLSEPFDKIVIQMFRNVFNCFIRLKEAKDAGVPIKGVIVRLPYDMSLVPVTEYIPPPPKNDQEALKRDREGIKPKIFNLSEDPEARLGLHDVSLYTSIAVNTAIDLFNQPHTNSFPVSRVKTEGIQIHNNNGTEHLSPVGNYLAGDKEMEEIIIMGDKNQQITLAKYAPGEPPVPQTIPFNNIAKTLLMAWQISYRVII